MFIIDYQDLPGRRANRQNYLAAATAEETCQERSASITSVDEETIHLLQSQNILVQRNYLVLGEVIGEGKNRANNCRCCIYACEFSVVQAPLCIKIF